MTMKATLPELNTSALLCPFSLSHSPTRPHSLVQQEAGYDYHTPPTHLRKGRTQKAYCLPQSFKISLSLCLSLSLSLSLVLPCSFFSIYRMKSFLAHHSDLSHLSFSSSFIGIDVICIIACPAS